MSNQNETNISEEDFLKKHLSESEGNLEQQDNRYGQNGIEDQIEEPAVRVSDLKYFNFTVDQLPCHMFYPKGTLIMVRPAEVKEIQAYSMVDDTNTYDMVEKMNSMLQSCVRIKYPGGNIGSYLELKDPDRLVLIFMIRELTFQQGNILSTTKTCTCSREVTMELNRQNFVFYEVNEKLKKYYNPQINGFTFKVKNGKVFNITPPNIGLQKAFTDYIVKETSEKRNINLSFLKIIPFMLPGRSSITYDGIKAKLQEFEKIDDISFQFLNAAISKMEFGIKELMKRCECGEEVRTDMQFPGGASAIFVIHDAFEKYLEE